MALRRTQARLGVRIPDPAVEQLPERVAERLDRDGRAASVGVEVIPSQLALRPHVIRLADVAYGQVLTLLIGLVPGPKGFLRQIAKLANG